MENRFYRINRNTIHIGLRTCYYGHINRNLYEVVTNFILNYRLFVDKGFLNHFKNVIREIK